MVAKSTTEGAVLADLTIFAQVAECGGLAAAARALNVQKAKVTRQLQRLEALVGMRLVHRGSRHFALTEEGRALLPFARRGIEEIEAGLAVLRDQHGPLSGILRIAAPYTYGRKVIGPRLGPFMALHPALNVSLTLSSQKADLLADEADIAIRIGEAGTESLIARKLSTEQFLLCAAPAHLARAQPPRRPADLTAHRFVDLRVDPASRDVILHYGSQRRRVMVTPVLRSNEPEVVIDAALAGVGIAIVPASMTSAHFAAGRLVRVLPNWELPLRDVNALYAPGRGGAPRIRAFLDYLVDDLAMNEFALV